MDPKVCERCDGEGEVRFNPSRSCPPDPQMEDYAPCPDCGGTGEDRPTENDVACDLGPTGEGLAACRQEKLDPAILTYRDDPSAENRAALENAQQAQVDDFRRDQTADYMSRTMRRRADGEFRCPRCGELAGYVDGAGGKRVCMRHAEPVRCD